MSEPYRFGGPIPESVQRLPNTARARFRRALRICGFWPATQQDVTDAIFSRAGALTVAIPAGEKPSAKLARLAREVEARKFEAARREHMVRRGLFSMEEIQALERQD